MYCTGRASEAQNMHTKKNTSPNGGSGGGGGNVERSWVGTFVTADGGGGGAKKGPR